MKTSIIYCKVKKIDSRGQVAARSDKTSKLNKNISFITNEIEIHAPLIINYKLIIINNNVRLMYLKYRMR